MSLPDVLAALLVGSLMVYALLGGADFGGGVWDLFATGPRGREQRALIEEVLAPVWEVNHIWLILAVVLMFSGFPLAFAVVTTALHVPLTVMLIGVIARGSAFTFRQYDDRRDEVQRRWGRIFAVASIVTPVMLGVCLGAVTSGDIRVVNGVPTGGFFASWLGVFPFACGLLALALFAFLAAVYLTNETQLRSLQDDFRVRALVAAGAVVVCAIVCAVTAGPGTREFQDRLLRSSFSPVLVIAAVAAAIAAIAALVTRRYAVARVAAIVWTILLIGGWALAQRPYLIPPDVTVAGAAAPTVTLKLVIITLGAGSVLLIPSLYWLLKLFRRTPVDDLLRAGRRHRSKVFDALADRKSPPDP